MITVITMMRVIRTHVHERTFSCLGVVRHWSGGASVDLCQQLWHGCQGGQGPAGHRQEQLRSETWTHCQVSRFFLPHGALQSLVSLLGCVVRVPIGTTQGTGTSRPPCCKFLCLVQLGEVVVFGFTLLISPRELLRRILLFGTSEIVSLSAKMSLPVTGTESY